MGVKNIFKRYELKFMLTTQQYIQLKELMKNICREMNSEKHNMQSLF